MATPAQLAERKKQQTRQMIVDAATGLFAEHGFERVTIAEIAQAAKVSEKTVLDYFPDKEALCFDQDQVMQAGLIQAVRQRRPGESVLDACRHFYTQGLASLPDQGPSGPLAEHARILAASPALQARQREIFHRHGQALAREIAATSDASGQIEPRVIAAAVVAAMGAVLQHGLAEIANGRPHPSPGRMRHHVDRVFDLLSGGLGDYGRI